jgi:metacaspase-1
MYLKPILIIGLCCCFFTNSFAQTRHALIVAIGNYPKPEENGWPVINSINDVPLIKNALISNQRFDEKNVQVLVDAQADKKGITDALDKLIFAVSPGDIVVIHFSCHGQQLEDDNNDEMDGLDEAIVPYGAIFSYDRAKYKELFAGYLRDDLFGEKIIQLRNRLGKSGDLLVTLDACHSGSGTRDVQTAKIRGANIPMVTRTFSPAAYSVIENDGVFKENVVATLSDDAATFVLISGAQARESNYECYDDNDNPVGSLSYAFSKALSSIKGTITYQGLFSLIENYMLGKAPKQKPVLEGDGINRGLFGGNYEKQQPYFSVNIKQSKQDLVVLNGGFVSGITVGSVINFFEPGTTVTVGKKPVGTGRVISVSAFTAAVKPDTGSVNLVELNPWAFINELAFGTEKIRLFVKTDKKTAKMLEDSLRNFLLVEFSSNCDLFVDTAGSANNWALKYPNTSTIFQSGFIFNPGQSIASLKESLKRFDRSRFLKGLTFHDPDISGEVQLVFIGDKGNIDSARLNSRLNSGRLELKENDKVVLRIVNTGKRNFYINVVDIQPDGFINPILPNKNVKDKYGNPSPLKWEDCMVKRADTILLRNLSIDIQKPYGEETFKVFLSSSPLDLEDILTTKNELEAKNKRGVLNGLEKIFAASNVNEFGRRGAGATSINTVQDGTIFSLNFQIVPKQK